MSALTLFSSAGWADGIGSSTVDAPAPITTLKAEDVPNDQGGSIDLQWLKYSPPADFDHYNVYRSSSAFTNISGWTPIASVAKASANSYRDYISSYHGQLYRYAVTAVDKDGNENPAVFCSNGVYATDNVPPPPVTELQAWDTPFDNGSSITLYWGEYEAGEPLIAFLVYRQTTPFSSISGLTMLGNSPGSSTGYTDGTASPGVDYYYGLVTVDNLFNYSDVAVVGPVQAYENISPVLSNVSVESSTIYEGQLTQYSFTSSEDGDYVVIINGRMDPSLGDGSCSAAQPESININASHPYLTEGLNQIQLKVIDASGNITYHDGVNLTIDRRPSAPLGVAVYGDNTFHEVHWNASPETDVVQYHVYGQVDGGGYELLTTTTYLLYGYGGSFAGTFCQYYVVAEDASGYLSMPSIVASFTHNLQTRVIVDDVYTNPSTTNLAINKWQELYVEWHPDNPVVDYIVEVGGGGVMGQGIQVYDYDEVANGTIYSGAQTYTLRPSELPPGDVDQFLRGENELYIYAFDNADWYTAAMKFRFEAGLSNPSVTPTTGNNKLEVFTFSVEYYCPGGIAPEYAQVSLTNNSGIVQTYSGITDTGGGVYEKQVSYLNSGTYNYEFRFWDALDDLTAEGDGLVVTKIPTFINISAISPQLAYFGNKVTVQGTITPKPGLVLHSGGTHYVQVTFTEPPGGASPSYTVQVPIEGGYNPFLGTPGTFAASFSPSTVTGQWEVYASYMGNAYYLPSQSATSTFDVAPVNALIECKASPASVPLNDRVDIAGKFVPLPNVGNDLSGIQVELHVTDPDSVAQPVVTTTTDSTGAFTFEDYSGLDTAGTWQVFATYSSSVKYNSATSPVTKFAVETKAGYAILIEGKASDGEGLAEHNKTLNTIYDTLITNRGFTADDITYLNYSTNQTGVDDVPSEATISYAISNWAATKMATTPAPLYIFMVGHGVGAPSPMFRVFQSGIYGPDGDPNNVDPAELDGWIDTLETALGGPPPVDQPIYVFYGSCYAGSFLAPLSEAGKNRVIVTSTEADELSGRQPSYGDPRDGEWFMNRFINRTADGGTIYESFEFGAQALVTPYPDQHPLLDDNADDTGSNRGELGVSPLDGGKVMDREIGYDTGAPARLSIFDVSTSITLGSSTTKPAMVWARPSDATRTDISEVWIEVEPPGYDPDTSKEQVVYSLQRAYADSYNSTLQRYEWTDFLDPSASQIDFSAPGTYKVAYYAKDTSTGQVTDYIATRVYKPAGSNNPAGLFDLLVPADSATVCTNLVLMWEPCSDADGGVTYTVEVSRQPDFSVVDILETGLTRPLLPLSIADGIKDYTDYYWRVFAVDAYGERTQSDSTYNFFTNNTNGVLTVVYGIVSNFDNSSSIDSALVSIGSDSMYTNSVGAYTISKTSGSSYDYSAEKTGYDTYNTSLFVSGSYLEKSPELSETNPDSTPPTSAISYPSAGATVTGTFCNISGTASDDASGVSLVEVTFNGWTSVESATGTDAWNYTWTLPSDGSYTIKSRATDGNSNIETPGTGVNVTVDNNPPTVTSFAIDSGAAYANNTSVSLGITATDTIGPDKMRFSNDTSVGWSSWVDYATTYPWILEDTEGARTVHAEVKDAAGHISSPASDGILLDYTPPSGALDINSGDTFANSTSVTLQPSATDANGIAGMRFSNDTSIGWSGWSNYTTSFPWVLSSGDGVKTVHVEYKDPAGNTNAYSDGITLDTTPPSTPSISIGSGASYANNTSVSLGISSTDANGLSDMRFSNDTSVGWSGWMNYSTTHAPWMLDPAEGAKTVHVEVRDAAGNKSSPGWDDIVLDYTPPSGSLEINSGDTFTNSTSVTLHPLATDNYALAEMSFSNDTTAGWSGWVNYTTACPWVLPSGDGVKTVTVRYRDEVGNVSGAAIDTITLDTTPPSTPVLSIDSDAQYTDTTSVSLGIVSTDANGVAEMRFSNDTSIGWAGWTNYTTLYAWTLNPPDGAKTVHVEVRDPAGNVSAPGDDGIVLDLTDPAGSLDINSGDAFTNSTSVTLQPSATDANGIAGMRFSNDTSVGWSGWANYTTSYPWLLPSGDGVKTVHVEYKDPAGNTYAANDSITLDGTPPAGTLVIDSGAAYTNTTTVSLTLSATDANGVSDMRFSNDTSVGWSGWTNYTTTYAWLVTSGEGVKKVYGMFRDAAGNQSGSVHDSIVLDDTDPDSDVDSPSDGARIMGKSYRVTGTATDGAGTGVASVEVSTDNGSSWHAATGEEYWYYDLALTNATTFYIKSRATDKASRTGTPGPAITAVFEPYSGTPENSHIDWSAFFDGDGDANCTACHIPESTFMDTGFEEDPGFCTSCHNSAGMAHDTGLTGARQHSIMASVTTAGITYPTYGNVTSSGTDNRMYANLMGGDLVVCVTCHNPMGKYEDYGRDWEYTTTSDNQTYTLQNGAWVNLGYVEPRVYRDTSLWSGPASDRSKKEYLVDPGAYTYSESGGFVTFTSVQGGSVYIYVTLDYPYLRATAEADSMCTDCHSEAGHMGMDCLVCHTVHYSGNLMGVRELIRTQSFVNRTVVFTDTTGANSFADGDASYDGVCEVCHETTMYHTYDGSGFANHSSGEGQDRAGGDCTSCHTHASGFAK